jgi:hypothetical protein
MASAFEPSMMNKRGTAGSRPRSIRSSINARTKALCSVAHSISPSGCLNPALSMPNAATSTRAADAVDPYHHDVERGQIRTHPFLHACSRQRHEVPRGLRHSLPAGAGTSPSGSCTSRRNFRVETLSSMRLIAHGPNVPARKRELGPRGRARGATPLYFPSLRMYRRDRLALFCVDDSLLSIAPVVLVLTLCADPPGTSVTSQGSLLVSPGAFPLPDTARRRWPHQRASKGHRRNVSVL